MKLNLESLVTTRIYMIRSTLPPSLVQNLKRPIHAMWYLDCEAPLGQEYCGYWSYNKDIRDRNWTQDDWEKVLDIGFQQPRFYSSVQLNVDRFLY